MRQSVGFRFLFLVNSLLRMRATLGAVDFVAEAAFVEKKERLIGRPILYKILAKIESMTFSAACPNGLSLFEVPS